MVREIFFRHQKSLRHLAMTLTKYSISAHLGAPRRGLRGDVMVTCHGTKTRHGNTAKSHTNVMVFPYRRERKNGHKGGNRTGAAAGADTAAAVLRWLVRSPLALCSNSNQRDCRENKYRTRATGGKKHPEGTKEGGKSPCFPCPVSMAALNRGHHLFAPKTGKASVA